MGENIWFQNMCRICTNGTGGISIYSEEGKKCSLQEKIKKFLSITVSEEDILPKMVCFMCTSKLDSIDQFASMALKMQTKLLDYLNAQSSGHPHIDELKSSNEATDQLEQQSSDESSSSNEESNFEAKSNDENILETKDLQGSLLHSILMKGSGNVGDVTEMEVKVDPMLFLGEDDPPSDEDSLKSSSTQEGDWKRKEEEEEMVDLKPYQCALCPRGFNSDLSLQSHLWNHLPPSRKLLVTSALSRIQPPTNMHRERGLRGYASSQCLCQVCGRVYPTRSTLRAHQITHSNLRPHKCSLCDKTFKRNQDLKFHINQHTGERPYRCPYCPKAFASSGNCFSHRKRMHPKQLDRDKKAANA